MKIPFIHYLTGRTIHEQEISDDMPSLWLVRLAAELSVRVGARLDGANLVGANLVGANLVGARLDGARLDGANLVGAHLIGANLAGAHLIGANLAGANLAGAYFNGACLDSANIVGANLDGAHLIGANLDEHTRLVGLRPVLQIGPIGSRSAYLAAYITDRGVMVRAGCFCDTIEQFALAVERTYGDGFVHGREYAAAIAMIRAHAELWTPAAVADQAAEVA